MYRFGRWVERRFGGRRAPLYLPLMAVHRFLYMLARNLYGIQLPVEVVIGRRLRIAHQHGIVLVQGSVVGDDCLIRHNVTLGARHAGMRAPRLGNRVALSPGVVIVGEVVIGDDARVGPNAVVIHDVRPGTTVVASLAQIVGDDVPEELSELPMHLGDRSVAEEPGA